METVINLHKSNINLFLERLNELNNKLTKKNQPKVEYFVSGFNYIDTDAFGNVPVLEITLTTEMKTTNIKGIDVHFEGVIDLINQEENSKVFHLDNPEIQKHLTDCECDECHKKIGRNKYIVFSKGKVTSRKDLIVLGTSCARNYFPFNIESYIGYVGDEIGSFWDLDEASGGKYSYLNNSVDFYRLYKATCEATDDLAYYQKDGVTRTDVCNLIGDRKWHKDPSTCKYTFEEVKEWLISAYKDDDSDFGSNIRSVVLEPTHDKVRERVDIRNIGLAIYSFIGAKKWHEKEVEKQIAAERKLAKDAVLEYFGNVGDKFEKELIFDRSYAYQTEYSYYGETTFIHIFHDEENHVFKWSTSKGTYQCWHKTNGRDGYLEYEAGKKYLIKGSIKDHSEYNGTKQTVITRCKVLKDEYENHVFNKKDIQIPESKVEDVPYEDPFEILNEIITT